MVKITIDKLAQMVASGFSDMGERIDKRFEQVDKQFDRVDKQFKQVEMRLDEISIDLKYVKEDLKEVKRDVADVKQSMVPPMEFEDLSFRVKYLEEKMGIESGK